MKALWVLNSPIGTAAEILGYANSSSGSWIANTEERLRSAIPQLEITYLVLGYQSRRVHNISKRINVIEIGKEVKRIRGKATPKRDLVYWKRMLSEIEPDLIHIWGTEYANFLDVINAASYVPCIITLQGLVSAISKYTLSNIPIRDLLNQGLLSVPATIKYFIDARKMIKQASFENKMLEKADWVLVDNTWSRIFCETISPSIKLCQFTLPVSREFSSIEWNVLNCNRHTIFTIAPSSPMKGLHVLIEALKIVKKTYPDIVLRIPGDAIPGSYSVIKKPIYNRYIESVIREHELISNICFVGKLNPEQMAKELSMCNVFIMPSRIENHSSTLREAMNVGCPCVSSEVGSINEIGENGYNMMLYRYEEYEVLARHIISIFNDDGLASKLGANAKISIQKTYPIDDELSECIALYKSYGE